MAALMGSYAKVFSHKLCRDTNRSFVCERHGVLGRAEIRLLPPPNVKFSLSISLTHKPISLVSSLSSSHTQVEVENEELQLKESLNKDTSQAKTVHVRFQLQRECSFGQHFLIVGDDPIFGMWDPENAVPLNWSDGHVWTVELDIPIGKSIKFKFIMKEGTEEIMWQPGPDRILETWESEKTITICEDWDNAEFQKIIEEEPTSNQVEDCTVDPEMLIIAENLAETVETGESNNINAILDVMAMQFAEKPKVIIAENISEAKEEEPIKTGGYFLENNGQAVDAKDLSSANNEGVPVLVPGLTPFPKAHTDEESINEAPMVSNGADRAKPKAYADEDTNVACVSSFGADIAKDLKLPENNVPKPNEICLDVKEEQTIDNSLHLKDRTEKRFNDEIKHQETETNKFDGMLDNNIQWGRKTWQKLLKSLGIQEYFV